MKFPSCLLAAALLILPAAAEIIGVEQFDYPDGAIAGQSSGTFWDYKNTSPTGHTAVPSNWDNVIGSPAVSSGRLVTSGNGAARREYNGNTETNGAVNGVNVARKVFYRVDVTTGPTVTPADYFGISSMDFGTERLYFGKRGGSTTWGVEEVGVGGTNGSVTILPSTTYTLVVHVDFESDFIRLFVDPDLSGPELGDGFAVASRPYTGTNWSTAVRFAAGTAVTWDNLVVATTWDDLGTVVTTTTDEDNGFLGGGAGASLREAVKYSPTGSLITFAPSLNGQTCTLSLGEMVIDKALTIDATALPGGFTLDGNHATRHFQVQPGRSLTLRGLTLTSGRASGTAPANAGGAIFANGSGSGNPVRLTLIACTLSGNSAQSGGGIYNSGNTAGNAILSLTTCTFSGNSAADNGGAIFNDGILGSATASLTSCTLSGNSANFGGGIASAATSGSAAVNLHHTILAGNTAPNGPDLYEFSGTITTATGRNLMSSTAGTNLGANPLNITIVTDPKLSPLGHFGGPVQTMHPLIGSPAIDAAGNSDPGGTDARGFPRFVDGDDSTVAQLDIGAVEAGPLYQLSSATDSSLRSLLALIGQPNQPQGIRIRFNIPGGSTITLGGTELTPPAGKAIFLDASNLSGPVTVSGNNASRVFNIASGATVAMHSVRIVNGKAPSVEDGGGILNAGTCTLMSSTLSENSASIGGGIFNAGTCIVLSSTLSGNSAGNGGAIRNGGTCTVISSTLSGNSAGSGNGNGGVITNTGTCTMRSSTVSGNSTAERRVFLGNGTFHLTTSIVAGNIGVDVPASIFATNINNILDGDPLLAPLGDYGGPTQTMALRPGSPARNAAAARTRTTDQRGFPIVGIADIGAYEAGNGLLTHYNAFIWETLPNTATEFETAATFDFDGDDTSNQLEWLADTGVNNPISVFRLGLFQDEGDLKISFPTINGRTYRLEQSTTLLDNSWSDSGLPPKTGNNALQNFIVTPANGPTRLFYRVGISQP